MLILPKPPSQHPFERSIEQRSRVDANSLASLPIQFEDELVKSFEAV